MADDQDEQQRKKVNQTLGIFVLMLLARVANHHQLDRSNIVLPHLVNFLPHCGFDFTSLLFGTFLDSVVDTNNKELFCEDITPSETRKGAMLAIFCKLCMDDATDKHEAAELIGIKKSRLEFLEALSNIKVLLVPVKDIWQQVEYGVKLLSTVIELWMIFKEENHDTPVLEPDSCLKLTYTLEVIQNIIIYCPKSSTRKLSYGTFVSILTGILLPYERCTVLKALIMKCHHSSMISLLFYLVKEEANKAIDLRKASSSAYGGGLESPFATNEVLDIMEFVLRPASGGPPHIPDQIDAVLSALNLHRFLLIKESTGKTNYTGILSKPNLQRARSMWLLPLQSLLGSLQNQIHKDGDGEHEDIFQNGVLDLVNLEGVACRCLELVEDALKSNQSDIVSSM